jgi:short-subunit dehydrogenase
VQIGKKKVDVAVNNAGFDLMVPLEEISVDEIKAQFETTFFGNAGLMQAVISMMRNREVGYCTNG